MVMKKLRWFGLAMALVALPVAPTNAQGYPNKLIRIVAPFPPGSATDAMARMLGQGITEVTGQNVIVENRPGASGVLAGDNVAKSQPDGYTILFGTHTTHAANRWLLTQMPFDPVKDFEPVSGLAKGWFFLVVNPKSPIKNVKDLIDKANNAPGTMTYGGGGAGSRVSVEQFAQMEKLKFVYVPYRGNLEAIHDLLGGRLDFMIADTTTALPQIKSGGLRAVAFTGSKRSPLVPDVPTFDEEGVKGYEASYWQAIYVPAKTPVPIVNELNALIHKAMTLDRVKIFLNTVGVVSFLTTPQYLAVFQEEQSEIIGKIIRDAGIEPQ